MSNVIPLRRQLASFAPAGDAAPTQPINPLWKPLAVIAVGIAVYEAIQLSKRKARHRYVRPRY